MNDEEATCGQDDGMGLWCRHSVYDYFHPRSDYLGSTSAKRETLNSLQIVPKTPILLLTFPLYVMYT